MYKFTRNDHAQPTLLENILLDIRLAINCESGILYLHRAGKLYVEAIQGSDGYTYKRGQIVNKSFMALEVDETSAVGYSFIYSRVVNTDALGNVEYPFLHNGLKQPYEEELAIAEGSGLYVPITNYSGEKLGVIRLANAIDDTGARTAFTSIHARAARIIATYFNICVSNAKDAYVADEMVKALAHLMSAFTDEIKGVPEGHTRHLINLSKQFIKYLRKTDLAPSASEVNEANVVELVACLKDIGYLDSNIKNNMAASGQVEIYNLLKTRFLAIKEQRKFQLLKEVLQGDFDERKNLSETAWQEIRIIEDEMNTALNFIEMLSNSACIASESTQRYIEDLVSQSWLNAEGKEVPWLTREEATFLLKDCSEISNGVNNLATEQMIVASSRLLKRIVFTNKYKDIPELITGLHEYNAYLNYPLGEMIVEPPLLVIVLQVVETFLNKIERLGEYNLSRAEKVLDEMALEQKHNRLMIVRFKESGSWQNL
ncbi:MAG TPA: hypothetical protein IAB06_02990 [Candidatus Avacidaminococcus intestinavium]|uniref:GAF domain-containing protein n=1 Tax=Candidatus Avacidaminococcus intestinavium TaxID=2840684 RepID=A0A9D1SLH0_9FIRM|nr:hypothetical protein [Candidatus Avacidaminococcus intestinavium]